MTALNKLRWAEHPENSSLQQLQFKNCGMWYTIEGTTVNSLNDALKYVLMQQHGQALGLI